MRNAAAPERRRRQQRADAGRRQDRAADRRPIAGPRSSGHDTDPSITVVATPLPETVPSRKPGQRHRAARRRAGSRPPHQRQRPVDEERAGARRFEHRAVDREQDDVGGRDVERHAEDPFERHVERADQPIERIAAMREQRQADAIEPRPGHRVAEEAAAVTGRIQPTLRRVASSTSSDRDARRARRRSRRGSAAR